MMVRILMIALIAMTTAACQSRGREVLAAGARPEAGECVPATKGRDSELLDYYARLKSLDPGKLRLEIESAKLAFNTRPTDTNRVALAMALSMQVSGNHDESSILELLQPLVASNRPEHSTLRPLALLLHSDITERQRLVDIARRNGDRTAEMQKRLGAALQRADAAQSRNEVLQERVDGLQQKLDALLEMEMNMLERELPPAQNRKQP